MHAVTKQNMNAINFNWLYTSHEPLVRRIIRNYRLTDATADDLVQDIFVKAWRGLPNLQNYEAISAWIKTIARNACINELKSQKVQRMRTTGLKALETEVIDNTERKILNLGLAQFESHVSVLTHMINTHKHPIRRQTASLFYLDHKSIKEIAETLQMRPNTVLSHLRRFRIIVTQAMQVWICEQGNSAEKKSK